MGDNELPPRVAPLFSALPTDIEYRGATQLGARTSGQRLDPPLLRQDEIRQICPVPDGANSSRRREMTFSRLVLVCPVFREKDRDSMLKAFELRSCSDVKGLQDAILERLSNGMLPCDEVWPPERVAVFQRLIGSGSAP